MSSLIQINSREYQCWHEVGHAAICIAMGGDVVEIRLMTDELAKGAAKTTCRFDPSTRDRILCGGFAAEYYLYKSGRLGKVDEQEFTQIIFRNSTFDREGFIGRELGPDESFQIEDDKRFMQLAIRLSLVIQQCAPGIESVVKEFLENNHIDGAVTKNILLKYL